MGNQTQRPNFPQLLEIPPGLSPQQFMTLLSDRVRDLNVLLKRLETNPAVLDLAMANFRITGLADPTDDLDAVNLRTLRKMGATATQTAQQQAAAAPAASSSGGSTNSAGGNGGVPLDPGGVPTSGTPIPPGIPSVTTLPLIGDPLSVVGQQILLNGVPYVFKAGLVGPNGYWSLDVTGSPSIRDVFANLSAYNAASYAVGTVFFATDWLVSYAVQNTDIGKQWIYYNGVYVAPIASLPVGLGVNDIGFTFKASDYLHNWRWDGAAFHFTTGGFPAGFQAYYSSPSYLPPGALWHACDGTTQSISQDDGSLLPEVLPNVSGLYIVQ